jgi:hypothetical protein
MRHFTKLIAAAAVLAGSVAASASTTFDFTSGATRLGNDSLEFTAGALSVNVQAFSTNISDTGFNTGGFTNRNGDLESTANGLTLEVPGDNTHQVDGSGANELVRFEFNMPLRISQITFTFATQANDQFDFFADTDNDGSVFNNFQGNFDPVANVFNFNPTSPLASAFGIGAGFSSFNDDFKIQSITVAAIPEPATWLMMILGFGIVGLARKRRVNKQFA